MIIHCMNDLNPLRDTATAAADAVTPAMQQAIRHAYWQERQIIEGSGAVCLAALLSQKVKPEGNTIACVTGGNIDLSVHHRIISGENVDILNL